MKKTAIAASFLALLLAALGVIYISIPAGGFDAYGVYRPAGQTMGPGGFGMGTGLENQYYVFQPGYAYLFSSDSPAPPDVPLTTWKTEYWEVELSPAELAENGLSDLEGHGSIVKKYLLQENSSGDILYERDGQLWMRMQVGIAAGGVQYTYRLEKLPDEALEEAFGVAYESLPPGE